MKNILLTVASVAFVLVGVTTITFADELLPLTETLIPPLEEVILPDTPVETPVLEEVVIPTEPSVSEEVPLSIPEEPITPEAENTVPPPKVIDIVPEAPAETPDVVVPPDTSVVPETPVPRIDFMRGQGILQCARGNWQHLNYDSMVDCVRAVRE